MKHTPAEEDSRLDELWLQISDAAAAARAFCSFWVVAAAARLCWITIRLFLSSAAESEQKSAALLAVRIGTFAVFLASGPPTGSSALLLHSSRDQITGCFSEEHVSSRESPRSFTQSGWRPGLHLVGGVGGVSDTSVAGGLSALISERRFLFKVRAES